MRQVQSTISADGQLKLALVDVPEPDAGPGQIKVRMEAAPINPSDIGLLTGAADLSAMRAEGSASHPVLAAPVPPAGLGAMATRLGHSLPCGNEGAGLVVAAGAGAEQLIGQRVAIIGGATYADYRVVRADDALVLPAGATAEQGASCFVNPLTALGFVETLHREGHKALVHTAAASNLGQMLVKICAADGIPLVNIVRNAEQVTLLKGIGADIVLDSTAPDFAAQLEDACASTGATLGFDAIGGGTLASDILAAMERALLRNPDPFSRYGSETHKQVYIYGGLSLKPSTLDRRYGMAWGIGGWLLFPRMRMFGPETFARLKARVAAELTTTFASHYSHHVSLEEMLAPENVAGWFARRTGQKYLVTMG
jgi:NADPH:quinone reductase-like Zn-dependent oxidoreductase